MSLVSLGGAFPWPTPPLGANSAQSEGSLTIGAANEKVATVMQAPKTGTITRVGFRSNTVSTSGLCEVRLETVGTDGLPSGTLVGTNTNVTGINVNATDTWYDNALTGSWTVSRGTTFAFVIVGPTSGTPSINIACYSDDLGMDFPYGLTYSGGAWSKANKLRGMMCCEYSDGTYAWVPGIWPFEGMAAVAFNSSSTYNYEGIRFKLPFDCRVVGAWVWMDKDASVRVYLYDDATSAGGTALMTLGGATGDPNFRSQTSGQIYFFMGSSSTHNLTRNTWYKLVARPITTGNISIYGGGVNGTVGAKLMDAMCGGQNIYRAHWNSTTSAWETISTARVQMGLMIDQIDDGTGSGGGGGSRAVLIGG